LWWRGERGNIEVEISIEFLKSIMMESWISLYKVDTYIELE
jgi:hypothetical protein